MTAAVRKIGLALGADLCWPRCFEDILERWRPELRIGGETVRFEIERVPIEPFDLAQPSRYDLVFDRRAYWHQATREWLKQGVLCDGFYVFNNPWSLQAMEKQTTYVAMARLGMPIPSTWLLPSRKPRETRDLGPTLERYGRPVDLEQIAARVGFPSFLKPCDGGGWDLVSRVEDLAALERAYASSGERTMLLQAAVEPWDHFVRSIAIGPQVRVIAYDPEAPLHARYEPRHDHLPAADLDHLRATVLTINAFFGWDFNSCECLSQGGVWHPVDFANPWPDAQVNSLTRHFPWLVLAMLRWTLFCAAVGRPFRANLDWEPFFAVVATDAPYAAKLASYARLARERFDAAAFEDFAAEHLRPLDEVAHEYFGTDAARTAVYDQVASLYPAHEVDEFTERFWSEIQAWRELEAST